MIDALNPELSINLTQARVLVRRLISGLRAAGIKSGDTVCLHAANSIYYPIIVFGVAGAGGIFLGTNPTYSADELTHQLKVGQAKFILTDIGGGGDGQPILQAVEKAASASGISKDKIYIFDHEDCEGDTTVPEGYQSWHTLLSHGERDWLRFDDYEISRTTTAMIAFSSGTTALPKAIMLSHLNLIAQHVAVFDANPRCYHVSRVVALPMFHAAVGMTSNFSTLKDAHSSHIFKRFDVDAYFTAHAKYQLTEMTMVPPMVVACIKSPVKNKKESLKTVRWATSGAAPLSKETQSQFQALLSPNGRLVQAYGLTEGTCVVTNFPPGEWDETGSVGCLIANVEAK